MLELRGSDIVLLSDTELRELVERLCLAELRSRKCPESALQVGGHQDEKDGGIDVRVALPDASFQLDFIKSSVTGFQVKTTDLAAKAITNEMCPNGSLRDSIRDLIACGGAYVIVSVIANLTDSKRTNRITAMHEAVQDCAHNGKLHLDYYDQNDLARWVNQYHDVAMWLRGRINKPLNGWQGLKNWSTPNSDEKQPFLLDAAPRLLHSGKELSTEEGIQALRNCLRKPQAALRLVGLSGVGKTRLAEALFDAAIGSEPLDESLVMYTDLGQAPTPSPAEMLTRLVVGKQHAVLVVDNCSPTTHRSLKSICTSSANETVSLLTIEYDVQDEADEEDAVFRIQPLTADVATDLLRQRFSKLVWSDAHRISELAGGNARLALAIAKATKKSGSLSKFSDSELFERLFWQGNEKNEELLRVAEASSLVYSFCADTKGEAPEELGTIASLAGVSGGVCYRCVQKLKEKELVQCRNVWRAVLPHALANRLAAQALKHIQLPTVENALIHNASERLRKSFARRLGYLHDSEEAQQIVREWIALWRSNLRQQPPPWDIVALVAPVLIDETFMLLTETLQRNPWIVQDKHSTYINQMAGCICYYAYREDTFSAAIQQLATIGKKRCLLENNLWKDTLSRFFQPYYSCTNATQQQRLVIITEWLGSEDVILHSFAYEAVKCVLRTRNFWITHQAEFGARPKEYGYWPQGEQKQEWYANGIRFVAPYLEVQNPHYQAMRKIFAEALPGLWQKVACYDELERVVNQIYSIGDCEDLFLAVHRTLALLAKQEAKAEGELQRIQALCALLEPKNLLGEARLFVLTPSLQLVSFLKNIRQMESGYSQYLSERVEKIGVQFASQRDKTLEVFLPEAMSRGKGNTRVPFGIGLAEGTSNYQDIWNKCIVGLSLVPEKERDVLVLVGFLKRVVLKQPRLASFFLDMALEHPVLVSFLPELQFAVGADEQCKVRLLTVIRKQKATASQFAAMDSNPFIEQVDPQVLRDILLALLALRRGYATAVGILASYLQSLAQEKKTIPDALFLCGKDLIQRNDFAMEDASDLQNFTTLFQIIVGNCLVGEENQGFIKGIIEKLYTAFINEEVHEEFQYVLVSTLFEVFPALSLNVFVTEDYVWRLQEIISENEVSNTNILISHFKEEELIAWAESDSQSRYGLLATVVPVWSNNDIEFDDCSNYRFHPFMLTLIDRAPDREDVLEKIESRLDFRAIIGSYANHLERIQYAIDTLYDHSQQAVVAWARQMSQTLQSRIIIEREREKEDHERFER